jgi:hypothetical protein
VSPDARVLAHQLDRLVTRVRLTTAVESAGLGLAVAAWSVPVGLAVAVIIAAVRSRGASRPTVVRRLEEANPGLRNVMVTAGEILDGSLSARPHVADRVFRDATLAMSRVDVRAIQRPWRVVAVLLFVAALWVAHAALIRQNAASPAVDRAAAGRPGSRTPPGELQVIVTVRPPLYTGLQPETLVNPVEVRAVENSQLEFSIMSAVGNLAFEINGVRRTLSGGSDRRWLDRTVATRSGYAIVTADDGARRLMTMTVVPDALPAVRLVSPGRDLVFAGGNPRLVFEARGQDDFGLRSMSLRFTRVSGSGERFDFTEGDIPLTIERSSATAWTGTATRALRDFDLAEGDMLVYRAVASDARPGANEGSSDVYFIEVSRLGVAAGDAFTLPEEETRYALSQQMLIVKTERLIRARGSLRANDFEESARGLAIEQRMIRSEFVFMLGGQIEDEAIEAEQSVELQEGRLANRGQRDLRAATVAMSQAEKHLTDAKPEEALEAERSAVAALQRAFARDRYFLRSLATRTPLDRARRLTGAIATAILWRRQLLDAEDNRRARHVTDLLQGLGDLSSDSVSSDVERRNRLSVLAEMSLRSAADSAALRQTATNLQGLADSWTALDARERVRRLDAITADVSAEARRALADPPAAIGSTR